MAWAENFWALGGAGNTPGGMWPIEVLQFVSECTLELAATFLHVVEWHQNIWRIDGTAAQQLVHYPLSLCLL